MVWPRLQLEGKRFGRLLVLKRIKGVLWLCQCDCGTIKQIRQGHLQDGYSTSCGCFRREQSRILVEKFTTHGHVKGGKPSRTYVTWMSMKTRCKDKTKKYHGGAGVKVTKRWLGPNGFANFLADMGERPPGKTIDRYPNPYGNYTPRNCRWATPKQQRHNWRKWIKDTGK